MLSKVRFVLGTAVGLQRALIDEGERVHLVDTQNGRVDPREKVRPETRCPF
jgi:hypothetical protein